MQHIEYDQYIQSLAKTLDEVLTFEIRSKALFAFKNSLNYKQCILNFKDNLDGNKSLRRLEDRFCYDMKFYSSIIGFETTINGKRKRHIHDVLKYLKKNSKHLVFIGKKNVKYESGKSFSHKSFILIKDSSVDELFNNKKYGLVKSIYYSTTARTLIHTKLLGTTMTKKQKEEYQKEYDEGKHLLTLEDYQKDMLKQKRCEDKRKMTIAKKAARETLSDYAKIQTELQQKDAIIKEKDAEIIRLKQLKDTNSDIENYEGDAEDNILGRQQIDMSTILFNKELLSKEERQVEIHNVTELLNEMRREAKAKGELVAVVLQCTAIDDLDIEEAVQYDERKVEEINRIYGKLKLLINDGKFPSKLGNLFCQQYNLPKFIENGWTQTYANEYNDHYNKLCATFKKVECIN